MTLLIPMTFLIAMGPRIKVGNQSMDTNQDHQSMGGNHEHQSIEGNQDHQSMGTSHENQKNHRQTNE